MKRSRSLPVLGALVLATALGQPGAMASVRGDNGHAAHAAVPDGCDTGDLPGGVEGPDGDGDECGFTITGDHPLPHPDLNPKGEFAQGSPALAKTCDRSQYLKDEDKATLAKAWIWLHRAPTGVAWLDHFLGGTGKAIHLGDNSALAREVKSDPQFRKLNAAVQAEAKAALDGGAQNVVLTSSVARTPDFSAAGSNPDPHWAFGGTQGLHITGSGFPEKGQYVGQLTYTIRDIYGFYDNAKFRGVGREMHYLQGVCGAPSYPGGAHWFEDSVTVTVRFLQPAG